MRVKAAEDAGQETLSLIRVTSRNDLPQDLSHGRLIYFSESAAAALNSEEPETQFMYLFVDTGEVFVNVYPKRETVFKIVVAGKDGNPTFLAEPRRDSLNVTTLSECKKATERLNAPPFGATLIFNTPFLEHHERVHMAFCAADARKLGVKEFTSAYYYVSASVLGDKGGNGSVAGARRG